jgi:predicted PurR-regulated permease PerM
LFVIISFFREGSTLYYRLKSGDFDLAGRIEKIQTAFPSIKNFLDRFGLDINTIQTQLSDFALTASGYIAQNALALGHGTLQVFLALGLMLYMAFFMLRDGDKLVKILVRALPLGDEREYLLFNKFAEVVRPTVKKNLLVAAVQGLFGGFIFWVLDIRGALLWGS